MGLPGFRSFVRGVSNTQVGYSRPAYPMLPISGKPEIGGPPHPSRRAPRDDCVARKRMCLRPPQDEADIRPVSFIPIHFQRDPF